MKTLVFDTCLNKTYVNLSEDEKTLKSTIIENKEEKYHSAFLISSIVSLLREYHLKIKDIDVFGVNIGPGSFTGIRACLTVARVFAQQVNKPLIGVSTMEILAGLNPSSKNALIILDARRKQVYTALYSADSKELIAPKLINIDEIDSLPLADSFIISETSIQPILKEKGFESLNFLETDKDLGMILSKIVNNKAKIKEKDYFWAKVKPLYLQTPPVSATCKLQRP